MQHDPLVLPRNGVARWQASGDGRGGVDSSDEILGEGSVQFIGTATVLLKYGGFTILTDPNFLHAGERAHLGYGVHAVRLTEPGLPFKALPPIDFVLVSHLHEDHFDRRVQATLPRETPIVTTPRAAGVLERMGFLAVRGLPKWDSQVVRRAPPHAQSPGGAHQGAHAGEWLKITAMPASHGPGPLALALPPVMGSMLEFGRGDAGVELRIYVTGDTLPKRRLREIPRRYPEIDLALVHLGGTRIAGLTVTMNGRQGVKLLSIVKPKSAIPIHFDDYDRFESPLSEFTEEAERAAIGTRIIYLARGQTHSFRTRARAQASAPARAY